MKRFVGFDFTMRVTLDKWPFVRVRFSPVWAVEGVVKGVRYKGHGSYLSDT